jgi:hypothetical protein
MIKMSETLPTSTTTQQVFCLRYYGKIVIQSFLSHAFKLNYHSFWAIDNFIYCEKLTKYNGSMFRTVHATVEVPNTPRKLVAYIQELLKVLAWKQAVVDYAIQF